LKNSAINQAATIYGNFYSTDVVSKYIVFEVIWCKTAATCPNANFYSMEMALSNFYKNKGG